jgi:hypothetical protein
VRRRGIWSESGPVRRRRHFASRWPRTPIAKTENHSLPGNYVTVTFLAGSPVPPMLSLSMFHHHRFDLIHDVQFRAPAQSGLLPTGRSTLRDGSAERALAGAGVEEQAQQVGDGRRTVTNEQLA